MFKNCTPHKVVVILPDGREHEFPPSGEIARVVTRETPGPLVGGIPSVFRSFGEVILPDPPTIDPGDGAETSQGFLIVSAIVLEAARAEGRVKGLVAPDTGPTAIRGTDGQIRAVTRWVTNL
jgi:hypothetical protein